jgi:hypothetical protein
MKDDYAIFVLCQKAHLFSHGQHFEIMRGDAISALNERPTQEKRNVVGAESVQ